MKKPIVHVTDHAVIRYCERVLGVDMEAIRRHIGHTVDRGAEMGASGVIAGGMVYKMRDGTVTTVHYSSQPSLRTGRQRRERAE